MSEKQPCHGKAKCSTMQAKHQSGKAGLASPNPVLTDIDHVVVRDETKQGNGKVITFADAGIHAGHCEAHDEQIERRKGQAHAPRQLS
jgi:hypothetical protein